MRSQGVAPVLTVFLALVIAVLATACSSGGQAGPPAPPPAPVTVATVERETVPIEIRAIGRVEAYTSVEVRSQVGGELVEVHLRRGQQVHPGDVLFEIDERPYRAALAEAEARLARDRALAKNARQDVTRYAQLVEKDYVTKEQYDSIVARADSLEATVEADKADVERAKLDLEYCTVRAPIEARAGDVLVHEGNVVKANSDQPLVVLLQTQPILVTFAVPERELATIRARAAGSELEVSALPSGAKQASGGSLAFIDNTVDVSTGTILLKGAFENAGETLWPGQFVDVVLELGEEPDATVVPTPAVQRGQEGRFVFVVNDDQTVEKRPVEVVREIDSRTVVSGGLEPGETVVTDGQLRLVPGAQVEIREGS
jgi:multidrug efflux system membrane fusion protein